MTKDNSTSKNKEFYDLGKKIFDRLNPHIAHNPKVVGPEQKPAAWMVYTQDGQSVYVTDNPTDIQEGQRALPLYTTPPQRQPLTKEQCLNLEVHPMMTIEQVVRVVEAAHGIKE